MPRVHLRSTALAGLAGFVGLVAIQHAFRADDLPPAEHFVSEYARGDGGWVQVVAFGAWAVSIGASAVLARRAGTGVAARRRVARALLVAGLAAGAVGAVACAFFATETVGGVLPKGAVKSTAGQLHDLGSAGIFFGFLVASIASTRVIARRGYRLSTLGCAALLLLIPAALIAAGYDAPGWGQRGFILVGCVWQWRFVVAAEAAGAAGASASRLAPPSPDPA